MGTAVKKAPVILIYPPIVIGNYRKTYPSLPVLAGSLWLSGYESIQLDLNNHFLDWYLRSSSYRAMIDLIAREISRLEKRNHLTRTQYDQYARWKQLILYNDILHRNLKDPTCVADAIFDLTLTDGGMFDLGIQDKSNLTKTSNLLAQFYDDFFQTNSFERPLFVGISVSMAIQVPPTIVLIRYLKQQFGHHFHVYCGGSALTLASHHTLKAMMIDHLIDGVVVGEGEEAVVEIARQSELPNFNATLIPNFVFPSNSEIIQSITAPHRTINEYPPPLYDKKELRKWHRSFLTTVISRRCYWGKCAYCNYQSLYLRKQLKDVARAVNEIESLTRKYRIQDVTLACDTVEPDYVRRLCRLMIERYLDICWQCYLRVDKRYSMEDLKLMKQSGCGLVAVGLESLCTDTLNLINKGYRSEEAVSFLRKLLKTGMGIQINMIIDLPGTDYVSAKMQYSMLRDLLLAAPNRDAQCYVAHFRLSIDFKMPLGRNPKKYGIRLRTPDCIFGRQGMPDEFAFYDPKGMNEKQKQSIEKMYDNLNEELRRAKFYHFTKNVTVGKNDQLFFDNKSVSIVEFKYEEDSVNRCHRKTLTHRALAYDCERDIFSTIYDGDIFKRFVALLPMKLGDLENAIVKKRALGRSFTKNEFETLIEEALSQGLIRASH